MQKRRALPAVSVCLSSPPALAVPLDHGPVSEEQGSNTYGEHAVPCVGRGSYWYPKLTRGPREAPPEFSGWGRQVQPPPPSSRFFPGHQGQAHWEGMARGGGGGSLLCGEPGCHLLSSDEYLLCRDSVILTDTGSLWGPPGGAPVLGK